MLADHQVPPHGVREAYEHLLARAEFLPVNSGLSQAKVYRAIGPHSQAFCLKSWPRSFDPVRLTKIHLFQKELFDGGCTFVPQPLRTKWGLTVYHGAEGLWDLSTWMPGEPLLLDKPNLEMLEQALRALAMIHRIGFQYAQMNTELPRVLQNRREFLERGTWRILKIDHILPPGCGIQATLERKVQQLQAELNGLIGSRRTLPVQPCLRDCHAEHFLFDGPRLSGVIDFGAVGMDLVIADLSRLLADTVRVDEPLFLQACAAYAEYSRQERENLIRSTRLLAEITLLGSLTHCCQQMQLVKTKDQRSRWIARQEHLLGLMPAPSWE